MFDLSKPQVGIAGVAPYAVIYGQAGIGKTTFAAMPPNTVIADVEKGIPERLRAIPRFPVNTMQELVGMLQALGQQRHTWTHLLIDSASALTANMTSDICREQKWLLPDGRNDMGERGYGAYGRGERIVGERWALIVSEIQKLKEQRNIAITLTAHVRIAKVRPPDVDEYARYDLALPAQAIEVVTQRADVVGFMSYPVVTVKDAGKQHGVAKAIGETDARLYLRSAATHHAKNRFELPENIIIPAGNPAAGFAQYARNIPFFAPLFQQQPAQAQQLVQ